jgi:hypothetical protein
MFGKLYNHHFTHPRTKCFFRNYIFISSFVNMFWEPVILAKEVLIIPSNCLELVRHAYGAQSSADIYLCVFMLVCVDIDGTEFRRAEVTYPEISLW